jgi:hypothetical protein
MDEVTRVTAGPGADNQALFQVSSNGGINTTSAGSQAIRTTNGGRTFFLTDLSITADFANTSTQLIQLEISGGIIVFEAYVSNTSPCDMAGIETQVQVPANSVLAIKWPAQAGHITFFVAGYED